jgi:hypothetical protein
MSNVAASMKASNASDDALVFLISSYIRITIYVKMNHAINASLVFMLIRPLAIEVNHNYQTSFLAYLTTLTFCFLKSIPCREIKLS